MGTSLPLNVRSLDILATIEFGAVSFRTNDVHHPSLRGLRFSYSRFIDEPDYNCVCRVRDFIEFLDGKLWEKTKNELK